MIYNNIGTLWAEAVDLLREHGQELDSRVGMTKEVLAYQGTLSDPTNNVLLSTTRRMSPAYACGEMLWYLSGERNADRILIQAPRYERFLNDGVAFGAYGERWDRFDQIGRLVKLLRAQPNTRQAVLACWFGDDIIRAEQADKKDLPCTLNLQFLLRQGRLHLIVTMRSNDVWLGMPYDIFCFTTLQQLVAFRIRVELGTYTHRVGSLHIYERDVHKVVGSAAATGYTMGEPYQYPWGGDLPDALECQVNEMHEMTDTNRHSLLADMMYTARTKTRPEAIENIGNPNLIRALEIYHDRD